MEQHGARLVFPIDVKKKPWEQKLPLHNRWHPDIPPVAEVTVGELFRVEMVDFSGGRITKEYSAEDIKNADPSILQNLNHVAGFVRFGYDLLFVLCCKEDGGP
ncbi:hypothetical protein H0E87_010621 [Populus deltoides]|uniref:Formamidase n=1 Tax=Populus deltoides TaxID=3696 RepID=A0A8T2YTT8_POPDE|nr:hypothetical protein H0E87_010621 [Populus deltoides]